MHNTYLSMHLRFDGLQFTAGNGELTHVKLGSREKEYLELFLYDDLDMS